MKAAAPQCHGIECLCAGGVDQPAGQCCSQRGVKACGAARRIRLVGQSFEKRQQIQRAVGSDALAARFGCHRPVGAGGGFQRDGGLCSGFIHLAQAE